MDEILEKVIKAASTSKEELKSYCRKSELVAARLLFAKIAQKEGFKAEDIAEKINRDRSTVVNMKSERYKPSKFYEIFKKAYYAL